MTVPGKEAQPVDTSADQVNFIAAQLDRLAGDAAVLSAGDSETDAMVMFDAHTASVIAATLRAILSEKEAAVEQAKASERMELKALRERDAAQKSADQAMLAAQPAAWMVEDLVLPMKGGPIFTMRRDRAEGLFGDPKEFRVTPLFAKKEGADEAPSRGDG